MLNRTNRILERKASDRNARFAADGEYRKARDLSFASFPDTRCISGKITPAFSRNVKWNIWECCQSSVKISLLIIDSRQIFFSISHSQSGISHLTVTKIRNTPPETLGAVIYNAPIYSYFNSLNLISVYFRSLSFSRHLHTIEPTASRIVFLSVRKSCPSLFALGNSPVISHAGRSIIIAYERLSVIGECKHRV